MQNERIRCSSGVLRTLRRTRTPCSSPSRECTSKIVVDQVSTIKGILNHLKGTGGGKITAVPLLLAYVGFRANTEQRSNTSRTALSQALHAETATVAAPDCNKGEEQIDAVTSTSSCTSLTHAHQQETATGKRGATRPNKLKLKKPKNANPT